MKIHHRNLLVAALSTAFIAKFEEGFEGDVATFAPHPDADGSSMTIYSGPDINTTFEPVDDVNATNASITFEIGFRGCTFDTDTNEYLWDGKSYELRFGEYAENLTFAACKGVAGDTDWVADCIEDYTSKDDVIISKAVLKNVFKALSEESTQAFLSDVFKQTRKFTEPFGDTSVKS